MPKAARNLEYILQLRRGLQKSVRLGKRLRVRNEKLYCCSPIHVAAFDLLREVLWSVHSEREYPKTVAGLYGLQKLGSWRYDQLIVALTARDGS